MQWLPIPPGKEKSLKNVAHSFFVFALAWVNFGIGTFQIDRTKHAGCAVAGSGHEDGVEVVLLDKSIEMNISEAQTGTGAPVAEQSIFDVLWL